MSAWELTINNIAWIVVAVMLKQKVVGTKSDFADFMATVYY